MPFLVFQFWVFKKMGFEALNWYCKPVAEGFWEKAADAAFGSYTPCAIDSLVILVSHFVLLGLCFYRIWTIFRNTKAQIYVLRNKCYNCVLGMLACYCVVEPVLRLVLGVSLFDMDGETGLLPPFEVISNSNSDSFNCMEIKLICCSRSEMKCGFGVVLWQVASLAVEASAWFSMLVLIGLETKQYVKEFRWYVRFGVVYVLVADAVLLDLVLPLKNSVNRLKNLLLLLLNF